MCIDQSSTKLVSLSDAERTLRIDYSIKNNTLTHNLFRLVFLFVASLEISNVCQTFLSVDWFFLLCGFIL